MPPLDSFYDELRGCASSAPTCAKYRRLKGPRLRQGGKSFQSFDDSWDSIEELDQGAQSQLLCVDRKGMIEVEKALMPDKPDAAKVTAQVNEVIRLLQRRASQRS